MSSSRGPGQMSSMPRSEAALWSPLEKGSIAPFQKKKPLLEARSLWGRNASSVTAKESVPSPLHSSSSCPVASLQRFSQPSGQSPYGPKPTTRRGTQLKRKTFLCFEHFSCFRDLGDETFLRIFVFISVHIYIIQPQELFLQRKCWGHWRVYTLLTLSNSVAKPVHQFDKRREWSGGLLYSCIKPHGLYIAQRLLQARKAGLSSPSLSSTSSPHLPLNNIA